MSSYWAKFIFLANSNSNEVYLTHYLRATFYNSSRVEDLPNDGSCDYGVWDRALPLPLKCRCSPAERWLSERPTESRLPSVGLQCAGSPPTTRRSGRLWRTLRRTGRRTDPRRIIPWTSLGPPYIWGSHEPQQPERTEQFVSHKNNFQH